MSETEKLQTYEKNVRENSGRKIILAIETGIAGGSFAVFENGEQIDFWVGSKSVSKSEDLLQAISDIFAKNNLYKREVERVIVSENPGSLTGLRIGMSIGLGLKNAFKTKLLTNSSLEALSILSVRKKNFITAFPTGRDNIIWRHFVDQNEITEHTGDVQTFIEFIQHKSGAEVIVHRSLAAQFRSDYENTTNLIDAGENIAFHLTKHSILNASDNV